MAVRLFCLLEEAYGRLVVMVGCGYGRLVVEAVVMVGWWLWGRLIALMGRICLIFPIKPIIPHKPHKSFRLFKHLKTETAIRDFGWLFALVCYEKFERT